MNNSLIILKIRTDIKKIFLNKNILVLATNGIRKSIELNTTLPKEFTDKLHFIVLLLSDSSTELLVEMAFKKAFPELSNNPESKTEYDRAMLFVFSTIYQYTIVMLMQYVQQIYVPNENDRNELVKFCDTSGKSIFKQEVERFFEISTDDSEPLQRFFTRIDSIIKGDKYE